METDTSFNTAVAALYTEHHNRIVRLVRRRVGDWQLAEDGVMFAWGRLLEVRPADHPNLVGWVVLTATRHVWAQERKTGTEVSGEDVPLSSATSDPLEQAIARDEAEAFAALNPRQRLALGLFAQGYSYKAIAEITGQTYTWVNRHIAEGKVALRKAID